MDMTIPPSAKVQNTFASTSTPLYIFLATKIYYMVLQFGMT